MRSSGVVTAPNEVRLDRMIPAELSDLNDLTVKYSERPGYNPYETRFGPRDAEVIDFVLGCGGTSSPGFIPIGAEVTLDIKVRFNRDVPAPMIGFAIKSVEGVYLHGTNTYMMGQQLGPGVANTGQVYRFAFRASLSPRTYFLDLGVAEVDGTPGGSVLDVRRASVLLTIQASGRLTFDGLMDIGTVVAELAPDGSISNNGSQEPAIGKPETIDRTVPEDASI